MVLGAVFTATFTWLFLKRNEARDKAAELAKEHARVIERLTDVESKLALVNQTIIPISMAMQARLIKELTHLHTPELDGLLLKVGPPNMLLPDQQQRLAVLLEERSVDMSLDVPQSERDAAHILPAIIRRANEEAEILRVTENPSLKLITIGAVVGVLRTNTDA